MTTVYKDFQFVIIVELYQDCDGYDEARCYRELMGIVTVDKYWILQSPQKHYAYLDN